MAQTQTALRVAREIDQLGGVGPFDDLLRDQFAGGLCGQLVLSAKSSRELAITIFSSSSGWPAGSRIQSRKCTGLSRQGKRATLPNSTISAREVTKRVRGTGRPCNSESSYCLFLVASRA